MHDDQSLNDTTPLIRVSAVGAVGALLVLAIAWLNMWGPLHDTGPAPALTSLQRVSDSARDMTQARASTARPELGTVPKWIWSSNEPADNEQVTFRKQITVREGLEQATLMIACDNGADVRIGGEVVGAVTDWQRPEQFNITQSLQVGSNDIEVVARNENGPAGLLAVIKLEFAGDLASHEYHITDRTWTAITRDDTTGRDAVELGAIGMDPWGHVTGFPAPALDREIEAPPGFTVELVYTVPSDQGSWVSITTDDQGRLIASDQSNGLFRITPPRIGAPASDTTVEPIDLPVGAAQGLLCLGDTLYVVTALNYGEGQGFYRVRDTDGDDQYDDWEMLRKLDGGGEHGPHAVIQGPDGMLYIVGGNHTKLPDPERSTVPRVWDEDQLLPRRWDARGHAVGIMAPGGWICRTDLEATEWELISVGYRNTYDMAFNEDGELFTYDADMEWDIGSPWYRPTRINHVVSGSDFGWRSGTGKWPDYYADSLPAVHDIGPGSPTGVCFGTGSSFPGMYQDALYAQDWTFGTIWALHLEEDGATYVASREPFITGRPLPVADVVVNKSDGAMYFVVGGRGVPSAIYRVRWTGDEQTVAMSPPPSTDAARLRELRRSLEAIHSPAASESVIDSIWPHLGHDDRFVRYAARIALEHQPTEWWLDRVWNEPDAQARINALIAAARHADASHQPEAMNALLDLSWSSLSDQQRLDWLRALSLCIIRMGEPETESAARITRRLESVYPAANDQQNRELCALLVRMDSPVVVARTVPLMERMDSSPPAIDKDLLSRNDTYGSVILKMAGALPQQQQIHYALSLRNAKRGWAGDLRDRYFRWFDTAKKTSGGLSFTGFLDGIREDALENVPEDVRARYATSAPAHIPIDDENLPQPQGPGRSWTVDELVALASSKLTGRDFANGKLMFEAASCLKCHRFAGEGSDIGGPDLTALATRYTVRDLAEQIIEPSRVVSDQYQFTEFVLNDGTVHIGRVVDQDDDSLTIVHNLLAPADTTTVALADIASRRPSIISPMMPNLIDRLNEAEVLDLMAYILSEGDERDGMFGGGD